MTNTDVCHIANMKKNENTEFILVNLKKKQHENTMHVFTFMDIENQLKVRVSARSKFLGVSGSGDRGAGDNSIQFINIGRGG